MEPGRKQITLSLLLLVLTILIRVQLKFLFQVIELKVCTYACFTSVTAPNSLLQPLGITSMTLTAVTDVAISVSMVILLQASKTGHKRTTDMINRLVRRTAFGILQC
jgi:hypothetical protein